ncbi:Dabb family protein [Mycobacterium branderi]|uniref:Stress responsive protein n=1 Tax=Mycobacterium branderi TaxID=43348 RepID=A0A7I7W4R7_9MYCO|nr:Dabb family protein [Mycobacterium branderi]MCV7233942.1 Dabb family protein [Mycobacterium branderi]ORA39530.1 stress responsive protein [Mycobacterium branderi]BBZ11912.1 stress responsive protein [Mycobacterium branderi]
MFSVVKLIDVAEDGRDCLLAALRGAATKVGAKHLLAEPTLPGSRNGGDILMHLRLTDRREWDCIASEFTDVLHDPAVARVNGASYTGHPARTDWSLRPGTVYRALLLRVAPGTDDATVARFEDDLRLMPRYVRTITAWQLSRVEDATGDCAWTHVFEQQFTDVDGLTGPYLMHPIHWAHVDRWFDPECPGVIVRDRVCHSFCRADSAVLS